MKRKAMEPNTDSSHSSQSSTSSSSSSPSMKSTNYLPESADKLGGEILQQGAEGRVYVVQFCGQKSILKERFVKKYRHPVLDQKLTSRRIQQEARAMLRCSKAGIDTPTVYFVDTIARRIFSEFVEGTTVKEFIFKGLTKQDAITLSTKIGETLARMHDNNIIHGDLTTSNMMIRQSTESLVLLDFGLSSTSNLTEDKAVDLYVLERAFLSTHPNSEELFSNVLQAYQTVSKGAKGVIKKLDEVRLRGRKKLAFG